MRLMTASLIVALATPVLAMAQTPAGGVVARPGNDIGTGQSLPLSGNASNISGADTRSSIAPRLPDPGVAPGSDPLEYLRAARQALAANQTGAAQEALERAETRALDRSVAPSRAGDPSGQNLVKQITDARNALAAGDRETTLRLIDGVLHAG